MPRVLLVDDEPEARLFVGEGLNEHGIDFEDAGEAAEALRLIDEAADEGKPYDAVVLNITAPVMDGWEIPGVLRENPEWNATLVVVVTGEDDSDEDRAEARALEGVIIQERGSYVDLIERVVAKLEGK